MLDLKNRSVAVDPEVDTRGNPIHRLIAAGLFLMVGIAVGTAIMIGSFRERALKNSERQLENTAQLLAVHFEQLFRDFDSVQITVSRQIQAGIDSPETFKQQMSGEDTHLMLKSKISAYTDLAGITVFDADGQLINSSETWPVADINVADRSYFKTFKAGTASTQNLIELLHSRISHRWSIVVSRAIVGNNGSFLGVISRGIAPANLEAFLATVSLADGEAIPIVLADALWTRFKIGEQYELTDAATRRAATENLFISAHAPSGGLVSPEQTVDSLQKRGVRFLVCMNTVAGATKKLAAAGLGTADEIRPAILAGLLPGVVVVPAMVVTLTQLQERGVKYTKIA
jgi:intracellular sulfur oxidation DsrE/DsrF family protein